MFGTLWKPAIITCFKRFSIQNVTLILCNEKTIHNHLRLVMPPPFIKITDNFTHGSHNNSLTSEINLWRSILRLICIYTWTTNSTTDRQTNIQFVMSWEFLGNFVLIFTKKQIIKCRNAHIGPLGVFGTLYMVLSVLWWR